MKKTDWDKYYEKPYKTAKYSRKITERLLINLINKYCKNSTNTITELGGANSCFYESICKNFEINNYNIIDNNQVGLNKFKERIKDIGKFSLLNCDALNLKLNIESDLTFSTGLIEHFSVEETQKVIKSHFDITKTNGVVIMSFPTPTFLYRITRKLAEILGLWIFYDERPLSISEVVTNINKYAEVLEYKVVWSIFLTQAFIVAKKN